MLLESSRIHRLSLPILSKLDSQAILVLFLILTSSSSYRGVQTGSPAYSLSPLLAVARL